MAAEGKLRLYLDECVSPSLAEWLCQQGWDVLTAHEAQMLGATDEEHLEFASRQGRILLTFNAKDFKQLAEAWAAQGREHAGIILCPAVPKSAYGQLVHRLEKLQSLLSAEQIRNTVIWLGAIWD